MGNELKVSLINDEILDRIKAGYRKAEKRLFLIDYDGTLIPISKTPEAAVLNRNARNILDALSSDSRNTIVIISGRDRKFMEEQFKKLNIILVSEHGFFLKNPGKDWVSHSNIDLSWKNKVRPLLEDYVDRCNGSMIEEKYSSLVWHYRNADEDMALLRINELRDDLAEVLRSESRISILEGDKVLEVKSIVYDKGTRASEMLKSNNFDFILALGDDNTDEDIFKVIPDSGFSIKVGSKLTNAKFNIKNQQEVFFLLKSLF